MLIVRRVGQVVNDCVLVYLILGGREVQRLRGCSSLQVGSDHISSRVQLLFATCVDPSLSLNLSTYSPTATLALLS
jgi:hypothetical protein